MSNTAAIALILATLCFAFAVIFYGSDHINRHIDVIFSGVLEGIPISRKHRSLKLSHMMLQLTGAVIALSIGAFGVAALATMVNFALAGYVTRSELAVVALAAVFLGATTCLSLITAGVFEYAYYRSVLRDAKRD